VPVAELLAAAREGMRDLGDRMGLELMRLAVEEERVAVTESHHTAKGSPVHVIEAVRSFQVGLGLEAPYFLPPFFTGDLGGQHPQ